MFLFFAVCTHAQQDIIYADWSNITYYNMGNGNGNNGNGNNGNGNNGNGNGWGQGGNGNGNNGNGNGNNPVPEPATYGMFMIGATLSYATILRRRPRK